MIRLADELGVSFERCVEGTGLSRQELSDPAREIAGTQEIAVLRNILGALDPEIPFGLLAGQRYHPATHGMWGFAVLSSSTARHALEIAMRYFDLSYSFNRLSVEVVGSEGRLVYDGSDNPEDVRAALIERDLGALIAIERYTLGDAIEARALELEGSPRYAEEFEQLFGVVPRFNQPLNCVRFDPAVLDMKQQLADELGLRVSEEQCNALIAQRGIRAGLAGRVRGRILREPGEIPSMKVVAAEFGMSTRTLRSQLEREQTSYRELVGTVREDLAEQFLASTHLTVDQIADRLGYAETSSFIAAFKRWKGVSPSSYRAQVPRSTVA